MASRPGSRNGAVRTVGRDEPDSLPGKWAGAPTAEHGRLRFALSLALTRPLARPRRQRDLLRRGVAAERRAAAPVRRRVQRQVPAADPLADRLRPAAQIGA